MAGIVLVNILGVVSKFETNQTTEVANRYKRLGYPVRVMRNYDSNNIVHQIRKNAIEKELLNG